MKVYSTHYQRFTPPYFKGIVCLFAALMLTVVDMRGEEWTCGNTIISISGSSYVVSPKNNTDGAMADLASAPSSDWGDSSYKNSSSYTSIIFEEGVTHIGANTFNGFSYITSITVPSTITSIGANTFAGCTSISAIHAPNPNVWASVELDISSGRTSHPFFARYNKSNSNKGQFYFYGKETPATEIVFTAGLTEIKKYAFSFSTGITYVHIPGTVTNIGNYALDCNIDRIFINKKAAPSTGTNAISWKTGFETYLFLRDDATNSYNKTPWLNASTGETTGATKLCYISDYSGIVTDCGWKSERKLYKTSGTIGTINWTLAENGTLTLNGTGSMPSTYNTTFNSADVLPWFRFRQLVNKVIIKGGITDIGNALDNCWAIKEISIQQDNIPFGSFGIYINYRPTTEKIEASIPVASLTNASVSNLGSAPWNNAKLDIALSEPVVLADNTDNSELLEAVQTYIELPFEVAVWRTLTNEQYNTFCLPFALTDAQLQSVFGVDYDLQELTGSSLDGETLNLEFTKCTALEAGKPYLLQPSVNVTNPVFEGVTITAPSPGTSSTTYVYYKAVYSPTSLEGGNRNLLFLGADNELFWPESTGNLNGFRAYFEIKDASAQAAKRARISMGGKIATGIENPSPALPSREGVKILRDGKLYLMYKGQMYDVQGRRI